MLMVYRSNGWAAGVPWHRMGDISPHHKSGSPVLEMQYPAGAKKGVGAASLGCTTGT